MGNKQKIICDGIEMNVVSEEEFRKQLKERFPQGVVIPVNDINLNELKIYSNYPEGRCMNGILKDHEHKYAQTWGEMNAEIRLQPEDYDLLWPDSETYFNESLSEEGLDAESNEMTTYMQEHPGLVGGYVEVLLKDEEKFQNCLFVEGVPMARVTQILQQWPQLNQELLKQALQLFWIKEEGVLAYEKNQGLEGEALTVCAKVVEDIQHMYTGMKPVEEHPYYQTDVRHKLDRALKKAASLRLQQLGFLQTHPASYDVFWSNTLGDNWECNEMTRTFNEMFKGYRDKIVDAKADGNRMRLNIYTAVPEYQHRIFEAVKCSWAFEAMTEITDRQELPKEIAESQATEREFKNRFLKDKFVGLDCVYFFEKGTPGFVRVTYDRKVSTFGDALTPEHTQYINDLVREGNILRAGSSVILSPVGPEKIFMNKDTGYIHRVRQENINGNPVLVDPQNRNLFGNEEGLLPYKDVTGRMTDAKVIGQEHTFAVRCKIDGVQQASAKLSNGDARAFINGQYDEEFLAYKYFASDLLEEAQEIQQERNKGFTR